MLISIVEFQLFNTHFATHHRRRHACIYTPGITVQRGLLIRNLTSYAFSLLLSQDYFAFTIPYMCCGLYSGKKKRNGKKIYSRNSCTSIMEDLTSSVRSTICIQS